MSFKIPIYTGGKKGEKIAPTLNSITIEDANPTNVVMVFDEAVTGTNLGFTIGGTTSTTFASISGSGTTWTGVLGTAATFGENPTVSYNSGTGDFKDLNNNILASITNQAVTNNIADPYGPELVDNGDFANGTTGWTSARGTFAIVGGQLESTDTEAAGAYSYSQLNVAIVSDKTYKFSIDVDLTGVTLYTLSYGSSGGSSLNGAILQFSTDGNHSFEHTATYSGTMYVNLLHTTSVIGDKSLVDNVSVKEVL